jgi:GMP synthase-like glutamine amidotransferase
MTGVKKQAKVAIIDLNNGVTNQGMRGIKEILFRFKEERNIDLIFDAFDLRQNGEIPDLTYDIYISTGGPGSPYDGIGTDWENDLFALLDDIESFNDSSQIQKKSVFLICHSFQLACRKYRLGEVSARKSNAFGIFPITITEEGASDLVFNGLTNPFYSVDSRDWQVVAPNEDRFHELGATILAIEKERPHVDLERCLMSIRFTKEIIGTQFHPEADPVGMKMYLLKEEKKTSIIENHGEEKYQDMLHSLDDPQRIVLTQKTMLPNFLEEAISHL